MGYVYQNPQTYLKEKIKEHSRQVELVHIAVSPGDDLTVMHFHTFLFNLELDPDETFELKKDEVLQEAVKIAKIIRDTLSLEKIDSENVKIFPS